MAAFLWFLAGVVFGGTFSVFCDRVYRKYVEDQIRIDALIAFQMGETNAIVVGLTNRGQQPIPSCTLRLQGGAGGIERLGSTYIFGEGTQGEWYPGQERRFPCLLDFRYGPIGSGPFFQIIHNHRHEEDVTLQLLLLNSDVVLWESLSLGQSLLKMLSAAHEQKAMPNGYFHPLHDTHRGYFSIAKGLIVRAYRKYKDFCETIPKY
jgi:hypothetical protein